MQTHAAQEPVADLLIRCKLEAAGVRPTRPRLALARAIFGSGDRHFTAGDTLPRDTRGLLRPNPWHDLQHAERVRAAWTPARNRALRREGLVRHQDRPHFHFYFEDTDELSDIPDHQLPKIEITPPEGTRVAAIDVIVRLKKA
jgi:Fur family iron response transcriptional regulator